jgi:hypothetical protein
MMKMLRVMKYCHATPDLAMMSSMMPARGDID